MVDRGEDVLRELPEVVASWRVAADDEDATGDDEGGAAGRVAAAKGRCRLPDHLREAHTHIHTGHTFPIGQHRIKFLH